jgi:hypothetical protein
MSYCESYYPGNPPPKSTVYRVHSIVTEKNKILPSMVHVTMYIYFKDRFFKNKITSSITVNYSTVCVHGGTHQSGTLYSVFSYT